MNTPNNAAALERLENEWRTAAIEQCNLTMSERRAFRHCADQLATLRATLAQPDALTSQLDVDALTQEIRRVDGDHSLAVDVLAEALAPYIVAPTSQPSGEADDSAFADWIVHEMPAGTIIGSPQWWAPRIARAYRLTHPSADAPGVAVDEWLPIETAPKEAPYWVVWSAYYQRPVVVTQRSNDNTYWEGDWDFDVQATHWTAALAPKPEGGHG